MEEWQKEHITKNLPELISVTNFNCGVTAKLLASNILCNTDVEKVNAERDRNGKSSASYYCYQLLLGRTDAYNVLLYALQQNKQTGAVKILNNGLRNFGIPTELDDFKNVEIQVHGKTFRICDYFPVGKHQITEEIFQDGISELEFYESFVTKQKIFVLANDTIPPQPTFYIPRFISNRIKIAESFFKLDGLDVFVFKNLSDRFHLSEIAQPHFTASSSSQLTRITSRFIFLEDSDDWDDIKKLAKMAIHLVSFDQTEKVFLLEDTSAGLDVLRKIGSQKDRTFISEDNFVQQQFLEGSMSNVCICDTPGMGKTFLLANIARNFTNNCTGRVIAFIPMTKFSAEFSTISKNDTLVLESILLNVFKYITPSQKKAGLLLKLVESELIIAEVFFDGFDELPSDKTFWMEKVFLLIKSKFRNVRIYITSRPHMRHRLEKKLGVIAYDILPFNLQNQIDFLVDFWSKKEPKIGQDIFKKYAERCIKEVNQILTKHDKEIAGIPLLCQLIAEIYAKKVALCSTKKHPNIEFSTRVAGMYQKFIEHRMKAATKSEKEIKDIEMVHMWHALKVLFPSDGFHDDRMFTIIKCKISSDEILRVGIIKFHSSTELDFLHRTFAEYFAAQYFFVKLQAAEPPTFLRKFLRINNEKEYKITAMLNFLTKTTFVYGRLCPCFAHSVIVSFLESHFDEVCISEELQSQLAIFLTSIPTNNLVAILKAFCYDNLYNLFSLFKEAFKKWGSFRIRNFFKPKISNELISLCIEHSTSQMFHSCIKLFNEVPRLDVATLSTFDKRRTLLQKAVNHINYDAVEYLVDRVPLKGQNILMNCVQNSYSNDSNVVTKTTNILQLLLKKDSSLINESMSILLGSEIDLRLIKVLVSFKATLTAVDKLNKNCVMHCAKYMSPNDYHEFLEFILSECKAKHLFYDYEKCVDPLPAVIRNIALLPETMHLLFDIHQISVTIRDTNGENLLFSAVYGDKLENLQQLVDRGLDYNARGKLNKSLLHVAAVHGGVDLVKYMFSLKLSPNVCDEMNETPLHKAVICNKRLLVIQVLLEYGADIQAKNLKGQTALHLAAMLKVSKNMAVIRYLVDSGLCLNECDFEGKSPILYCRNLVDIVFLIVMGGRIPETYINRLGRASGVVLFCYKTFVGVVDALKSPQQYV